MIIYAPSTATYDADLAELVGVPAAVLYNQLVGEYNTGYYREHDDDWFFLPAQDFIERTALTEEDFEEAIYQLSKAGYIEHKMMNKKPAWRKNTDGLEHHFRFLNIWEPRKIEVGNKTSDKNGDK